MNEQLINLYHSSIIPENLVKTSSVIAEIRGIESLPLKSMKNDATLAKNIANSAIKFLTKTYS